MWYANIDAKPMLQWNVKNLKVPEFSFFYEICFMSALAVLDLYSLQIWNLSSLPNVMLFYKVSNKYCFILIKKQLGRC